MVSIQTDVAGVELDLIQGEDRVVCVLGSLVGSLVYSRSVAPATSPIVYVVALQAVLYLHRHRRNLEFAKK